MRERIHLSGGRIAVTLAEGQELSIEREEIFSVSVHALDLIESTMTYVVLDHENGESLELHSNMEGWEALVRELPGLLGIPDTLWREALRTPPDRDPIQVFQREG